MILPTDDTLLGIKRVPLTCYLGEVLLKGNWIFRGVGLGGVVQLPLPGEILYFFDPGTGGLGAKKPVGEIVVVYGRGVTLRAHEGVPTHCALCARIPGDWKYDWPKFAQECRKSRWEGPQLLRIERVEGQGQK